MTITVDAEQDEQFKALLRDALIDNLRSMAVEKLVLVAAAHHSSAPNVLEVRAQHLKDASGLSMLATLIEAERSAMITANTMARLLTTVRTSTDFGKSEAFEGIVVMIEAMFD